MRGSHPGPRWVLGPTKRSKYVEDWGIEPQTLGLQSRCSPAELIPRRWGLTLRGGGGAVKRGHCGWSVAATTTKPFVFVNVIGSAVPAGSFASLYSAKSP